MPLFRKKPIIIEAHRWLRNGDHPEDFSDRDNPGGVMRREGMLVRYYRRPDDSGDRQCEKCNAAMRDHGWIDTLEGGHIVCPGDWIITGVANEKYPCKPDIFTATYEPVEEDPRIDPDAMLREERDVLRAARDAAWGVHDDVTEAALQRAETAERALAAVLADLRERARLNREAARICDRDRDLGGRVRSTDLARALEAVADDHSSGSAGDALARIERAAEERWERSRDAEMAMLFDLATRRHEHSAKIQRVVAYREATGAGLKEAKEAVEALDAQHPPGTAPAVVVAEAEERGRRAGLAEERARVVAHTRPCPTWGNECSSPFCFPVPNCPPRGDR